MPWRLSIRHWTLEPIQEQTRDRSIAPGLPRDFASILERDQRRYAADADSERRSPVRASVSSLASRTPGASRAAACSNAGAIIRQGPHHGAQKSTTSGKIARRDLAVEIRFGQLERMSRQEWLFAMAALRGFLEATRGEAVGRVAMRAHDVQSGRVLSGARSEGALAATLTSIPSDHGGPPNSFKVLAADPIDCDEK